MTEYLFKSCFIDPIEMTIEEWTTNPLLLLIVGAIFSSVLIPYVTRRWQNHQAELELERDLVEDISNAVTLFLTKLEFIEQRGGKLDDDKQKEFETAELEWHKGCSSVGSYIQAYFINSQVKITEHWSKYADLINDFYRLTETHLTENSEEKTKNLVSRILIIKTIVTELKESVDEHYTRKGITSEMKMFFISLTGNSTKKVDNGDTIRKSIKETKINWDAFASANGYLTEWRNIKKFIFDYKHFLMKEIIDSRISGF